MLAQAAAGGDAEAIAALDKLAPISRADFKGAREKAAAEAEAARRAAEAARRQAAYRWRGFLRWREISYGRALGGSGMPLWRPTRAWWRRLRRRRRRQ